MASDTPAEVPATSLASRITRDTPVDPKAESFTPASATDTGTDAAIAQTDGAPETMGGSNLEEPEYDVEVKLNDLQGDPNNPLFSIKSFEELGL